ncbi:hypothetical protein HYV10_02340 [Candidatus Dependentiae bacterium]|nr:hypothetical protein [Candidatus Dependentiae bacterium]
MQKSAQLLVQFQSLAHNYYKNIDTLIDQVSSSNIDNIAQQIRNEIGNIKLLQNSYLIDDKNLLDEDKHQISQKKLTHETLKLLLKKKVDALEKNDIAKAQTITQLIQKLSEQLNVTIINQSKSIDIYPYSNTTDLTLPEKNERHQKSLANL